MMKIVIYNFFSKQILILRKNYLIFIKDWAYIINLDEYSDTGIHWVALYVQNNNATYFDTFGA